MKYEQTGFIHLPLLLIIIGSVFAISGVGFSVYKVSQKTKKSNTTTAPVKSDSAKTQTPSSQNTTTPTNQPTTESKPTTTPKTTTNNTTQPTTNTQTPAPSTNNNPTIKINSPANNATVGGNPSFSITSNTPSGFDNISVSIYFNDTSCQEPECFGYSVAGNSSSYYPTLNFTWDTDSNNNGNVYRRNGYYTIEAEVTDTANKKATTSLVFNLQR